MTVQRVLSAIQITLFISAYRASIEHCALKRFLYVQTLYIHIFLYVNNISIVKANNVLNIELYA